jgi:hypothetical protein
MQRAAFIIAATLLVLASDANAQGTRDYTGPLPPTNVAPLSTGTTPPTPNWRANAYYAPGYGYGYGNRVVPLRRAYPVRRVR